MRRILAARPDHRDSCFFSALTWGSTRTSAGSLWAGSTQSFRDGAACSKPVGDDLSFGFFFFFFFLSSSVARIYGAADIPVRPNRRVQMFTRKSQKELAFFVFCFY
ncbi:hypothetical protein I7I48_10720 [Histoplasma ohiense]|nr:hypothetical protein I7I48_10720 [Histoplasma ohiense (nom. inval.)]